MSYDNFYCVLCNLQNTEYTAQLNGFFTIVIDGPERPQGHGPQEIIEETGVHAVLNDFARVENQFRPWRLMIACPQYLDYSHYLLVGDLLKTAHKLKCLVKYNNEAKKTSLCDFRDKVKCTKFANWTYADNDTEWACNNVMTYPKYYSIFFSGPTESALDFDWSKTYRRDFSSMDYTNVFCGLCKPIYNFTTDIVDRCNATGLWRVYKPNEERNCNFLPQTFYYYPFKNYYCMACNGLPHGAIASDASDVDLAPYDRVAGVNWFSVVRNLFSVSEGGEEAQYFYDVHHCREDQLYDYISVRHLMNYQCFLHREKGKRSESVL